MDDNNLKKDDFSKEELSFPAFEALERDFSDVMAALSSDPSSLQFRLEHEKLFKALKKSISHEKRLLKRCRELSGEVLSVAAKMQPSQKPQKDDQDQTVAESFKKDIDKAWIMANESHENEMKALDNVSQLQEEISELKVEAEKNRRLIALKDASIESLTKKICALMDKKDQEEAQLRTLEERNKANCTRAHRLESEIVELQVKLRSSTEEANQRHNLLIAEKKHGIKLEEELQTYQLDLEKALAHCSNMQLEVDLSAKENAQLQKQLSQLTVAHEKCNKDLELSNIALKRSGLDLIEQKEKNESTSLEVKDLLYKAKVSHNDQLRLASEKTQLEKKLSEKNQSINRLKKIADDSKEALIESQGEIKALNRELEAVKSREDRLRREVSTLEREKDLHLGIIQKSQLKVKEADTEVHKNEQIHLSLEKELLQMKDELKKQQSIIRQLERELERGGKEIADTNIACEELKTDLIQKKAVITDLQLQISENEAISLQLQHDAAKNERLKFSKQAIDDQRQMEELTSKIKSMQSEITQLKGEINTKELEMAKKAADNQKEHSRNDRNQNDLSHVKKMLQEQVAIVEKRDSEVRLLSVTIHRMEEESMVFKKEREQALNERDILASQLVRRNDEIALLYEKIKILQIMMGKGELQYRERVDDIRLLKLKIKDLQREKVTGMKETAAWQQCKKDLIRTHRDLLREKLKVKTLSEELENPLNVHRWRRLEGSDPDCFEMIQKIQSLQKRLMQKTEELIQRDIVIQEQEKNNRELQSRLTRQSETDASTQLAKYQREIQEKNRQVNSLKGELTMYQTMHKEQQENVQRELDAERHKICSKCKRGEVKNHLRILRSCDTEALHQKFNDTPCPTLKILGGGFVLKN